jgi:TonB family protein
MMRKSYALLFALVLPLSLGAPGIAHGQQSAAEGVRRVIKRVEPRYPDMARKINLGGTVKVVAVVASDGNVKKVELLGGSPLLVEAAQTAISQWKYAPGSESRETVELHFIP